MPNYFFNDVAKVLVGDLGIPIAAIPSISTGRSFLPVPAVVRSFLAVPLGSGLVSIVKMKTYSMKCGALFQGIRGSGLEIIGNRNDLTRVP